LFEFEPYESSIYIGRTNFSYTTELRQVIKTNIPTDEADFRIDFVVAFISPPPPRLRFLSPAIVVQYLGPSPKRGEITRAPLSTKENKEID
jgi:hypothetical protein